MVGKEGGSRGARGPRASGAGHAANGRNCLSRASAHGIGRAFEFGKASGRLEGFGGRVGRGALVGRGAGVPRPQERVARLTARMVVGGRALTFGQLICNEFHHWNDFVAKGRWAWSWRRDPLCGRCVAIWCEPAPRPPCPFRCFTGPYVEMSVNSLEVSTVCHTEYCVGSVQSTCNLLLRVCRGAGKASTSGPSPQGHSVTTAAGHRRLPQEETQHLDPRQCLTECLPRHT